MLFKADGLTFKIPSLKSYFLSEDNAAPRFVRLKSHFEEPMTETYLMFYQSALQSFIKLNLNYKETNRLYLGYMVK